MSIEEYKQRYVLALSSNSKKKKIIGILDKISADLIADLSESYKFIEKLESAAKCNQGSEIRKFLVEKGIWEN